MLYKRWIKNLNLAVFLIMTFTTSINFIADPLWTFSHQNIFSKYQDGFDERQQKTNFIYFNGLNKYDGLLLGSSRTTYINQNDFGHI